MDKEQIILNPISKPRKVWEKAFEKMAKSGDNNLLIDYLFRLNSPTREKSSLGFPGSLTVKSAPL